ncbi:MAG: phosphoglycerate kinase [Candidatus Cloacimonetes bacterium]|nr:phosphoglycerate kinase [Candidatus Cloacimonadota bacterium]
MNNIPSLQNADLKQKIVLIRVDHNVVKKGIIIDPYRIDASIGTIKYIIEKGGKPILMTHIGRPKDKKTGMIKISDDTSVEPIVKYIKDQFGLKFKIAFDNKPDFSGPNYLSELRNGVYDGIYLPNTRWFPDEESKEETTNGFGKELSGLADIFVNDAFGSWQPHASTVQPPKHLPSYAGLLMQKEIENLERILSPQKPFLAVVAGSKFDTKIGTLQALLKNADHLIVGGVLYNAYLCAKYDIQIKGVTEADIAAAKKFVDFSNQYPGKLIEIPDIVESKSTDSAEQSKTLKIKDLTPGKRLDYILDADPASFQTQKVKSVFSEAKTIFVNAVMGLTPHFAEGTIALNKIIAENEKSDKFFGGGDTLQEFKTLLPKLYNKALDDSSYYFFTGGGTILKALYEEKVTGLAPIQALIDNHKKFKQ